jgi:hypothetical protein
MSSGASRRVTIAAVAITVVTVVAVASLWLRGRSVEVQYGLFLFHNAPAALLLSWLGRLVILRRPGNRIGPVLIVIAGLAALHCATAALADLAIVRWGYDAAITMDHPLIPAEMPLSASVPFWVMNWLWLPQVVLLLTVLPLIFPDGSLPGRRWRFALWLAAGGGTVFLVGLVIDGWPTSTWGTGETPAAVGALLGVGLLITGTATLVSVAALVTSWRRAEETQRMPFRIVGSIVGVLAVLWIATYPWPVVWIPTTLVGIHVLLAAYALAVARFRVHDLEPVLARSAVATGLSIVATTGFVAVVLAAGVGVARLSDRPAMPWIAVGVVAGGGAPPGGPRGAGGGPPPPPPPSACPDTAAHGARCSQPASSGEPCGQAPTGCGPGGARAVDTASDHHMLWYRAEVDPHRLCIGADPEGTGACVPWPGPVQSTFETTRV